MAVFMRRYWGRVLSVGRKLVYPTGIFAVMFLAFWVLVRTAWLCDDAYITFRSVDNFVNGYGPVWNVHERVQAFTHPLWMLVMSGIVFLTREVYFSSLILSIALSLGTFGLLLGGLTRNRTLGIGVVIILLFSRSFVDYSTGGLENPLTHFLLVLFALIYLRERQTLSTLGLLSLTAALCVLNRLDALLLVGPALAKVYFDQIGWRATLVLVAGFMPLVAWELFSFIYYGALIPNSALAKLGAGLTRGDRLQLGWYFYAYTWKQDPITLPAILIGTALPFFLGDKRRTLLSGGVILYLAYILWVGGVYMGGRFLTAPLLMAAIIVVSLPVAIRPGPAVLATVIAVMLSLTQPFAPITTGVAFGEGVARPVMDKHKIDDCRQSHYEWTGLLRWMKYGTAMPDCGWADIGRRMRGRGKPAVYTRKAIGIVGYTAGPKIHFADYYALADPLLARLPAAIPWWRTCHYGRPAPEGYLETLETGMDGGPVENKLADPKLAEFYDHLLVITRAPLFSEGRMKTILKMNLGHYDHLIDRTHYRFPDAIERDLETVQTPFAEGTPWQEVGVIDLSDNKLRIHMKEPMHSRALTISLDHNDTYRLYFLKEGNIVGQRLLTPDAGVGLSVRETRVPWLARIRGFNDLVVVPLSGDGMYSFGHLHLAS